MKNFKYTARSLSGQSRSGVSQAVSRNEVVLWLRDQGLIPVEIEETSHVKKKAVKLRGGRRIKSGDIASFCWQLRTMIEGGVPITAALDTISADCENKNFREIVSGIGQQVEKGETLSDSVASFPKVFNKLFQTMISAGEKGGALTKTLDRLASYFDERDAMMRKIKGALAYPAFVVFFIVFLIVFIMTFIIPRFKILFDQIGGSLPFFTQMFIGGYDYIITNGMWMILVTMLMLTGMVIYFKSRRGWSQLSVASLKVPIFGKIITQAFVAMFAKTFATLLSAGVSVLDALEILSTMSSNTVIRAAIRQTRENIVSGSSISTSMATCGFFPNILVKMVEVGEASGSLPEVLDRTSDYYEKKVDATISTAMTLLEPILIISVGILVLGVVLALYLPIFSISDVKR